MALVVSVPSPASRYLVALGRAVAELRAGARVAIAAGRGRFARLAAEGLEAKADSLGLELLGRFPLTVPARRVLAAGADAVLACGPLQPEVALLRQLAALSPHTLLGGVSPGILDFPRQLGGDPDGFLAPVQWHRDLGAAPELGPPSAEVLRAARARGLPEPDYLAAQAYAAALVAERCSRSPPTTPCSRPGSSQPRPSSAAFGSIPAPACSAATGCRSCAGRAAGSSCCSPKRPERRGLGRPGTMLARRGRHRKGFPCPTCVRPGRPAPSRRVAQPAEAREALEALSQRTASPSFRSTRSGSSAWLARRDRKSTRRRRACGAVRAAAPLRRPRRPQLPGDQHPRRRAPPRPPGGDDGTLGRRPSATSRMRSRPTSGSAPALGSHTPNTTTTRACCSPVTHPATGTGTRAGCRGGRGLPRARHAHPRGKRIGAHT